MSLPQFILLKSNANNKFLCYGKEEGPTHASLRFSHEMTPLPEIEEMGAEVVESEVESESETKSKTDFHFIKFEVEKAKTAEGFVHIRTCYNNKYWARKVADSKAICAEANEPEEDQSKWSCTLFKPIILGSADDDGSEYDLVPPLDGEKPQKIQLVHVSELEQHYVDGDGGADCSLEERSSASPDAFTAYNVVATALLPQHVTFISHDSRFISNFRDELMGFDTTDVGARGVAMLNPVAITTPQFINLRVRDTNRNWWLYSRLSSISASTSAANTRFGPIQLAGGHIALLCQANNNFVHRTSNANFNGLAATSAAATIIHWARFRVGEPVLSREITNVNYNLADARVYDTTRVEKFVDSRTNNTSVDQTGEFQVEYVSTHTTSWNQSLTVHQGITVSWSVGVPYVGEFGLSITNERTRTTEWGEVTTEERRVGYTQTLTIPARKRVILRVLATEASCDVPFTCRVRDVMTNGVTREYNKNDGLFVGANEFSFNTVIDEEDI